MQKFGFVNKFDIPLPCGGTLQHSGNKDVFRKIVAQSEHSDSITPFHISHSGVDV